MIFTKEYWQRFFSKLFSLFVSAKILIAVGVSVLAFYTIKYFTELLMIKQITSDNYTTLINSIITTFGVIIAAILGIRGVMKVVDIYREMKNKNTEIIEESKGPKDKIGFL